MRLEIQTIKLKSKNLNYGETTKGLNNQLVMKERTKKVQEENKNVLTQSIQE